MSTCLIYFSYYMRFDKHSEIDFCKHDETPLWKTCENQFLMQHNISRFQMQIERFHYVLHASSHPYGCNRNWKNRRAIFEKVSENIFLCKRRENCTQNSLLEFIIV